MGTVSRPQVLRHQDKAETPSVMRKLLHEVINSCRVGNIRSNLRCYVMNLVHSTEKTVQFVCFNEIRSLPHTRTLTHDA